jgi:hypothetical protein
VVCIAGLTVEGRADGSAKQSALSKMTLPPDTEIPKQREFFMIISPTAFPEQAGHSGQLGSSYDTSYIAL